jgi:hypothetical protein
MACKVKENLTVKQIRNGMGVAKSYFEVLLLPAAP